MAPKPPFLAFTQYEPNEAACIVFIVVFVIIFFVHLFQSVRARIWYMWPLIFATGVEVTGYALREFSIHNRTQKPQYIAGQTLVIVAPACLAAELYMLTGRAMVFVGPGYSLIRPGWITPIFVGFDILSIATQGIGAAVLFGGDINVDKIKKGRVILILGLFIQLAAFICFLLFAVFFDRKTTRVLKEKVAFLRPLMNAFYISGALILLRSVYRAVEFISVDVTKRPVAGYLYTTEWPYYVLDALPIAFAIAVYNIFFPGKYLPKTKQERLLKEGEVIPMDGNGVHNHNGAPYERA